MSKISALLVGTLLIAGTAMAFDQCDCTCPDSGRRQAVSDNRTINEGRAQADGGYFMKDGKVWVSRNGNEMALEQETAFEDGTRLMPDGTVILRDGSRSRIGDHQSVSLDGRFMDRGPDALRDVRNTRDGYFMLNGKIMAFRNGNMTEVTAETTLDNGARILPDGTLIQRDGTRSRISNDQFLSLNGEFINNAQKPRESVPAKHEETQPRQPDQNRANEQNRINDQNRANAQTRSNEQNRVNDQTRTNEQNRVNDQTRTHEQNRVNDQTRTNEQNRVNDQTRTHEQNRVNDQTRTNEQNRVNDQTRTNDQNRVKDQNHNKSEENKPAEKNEPQPNPNGSPSRNDENQNKADPNKPAENKGAAEPKSEKQEGENQKEEPTDD